jgi:hypothetical protein
MNSGAMHAPSFRAPEAAAGFRARACKAAAASSMDQEGSREAIFIGQGSDLNVRAKKERAHA